MAIQTDKIQYGGDLMIFIGNTPIAFSTSAKFDISLKTRDIGSKDSGKWDEKAGGKMSWTASTDALMSDSTVADTTLTYNELYTSMATGNPVAVVFATVAGTSMSWTPSAVAGKTKFSGNGIITSLSLNAPDGDNATLSISIESTGGITMA